MNPGVGGARPAPPVLHAPPTGPSIARGGDRRVTASGVIVAAAFVAVAVGSLALPAGLRRGIWLPLHLALAGAAGTAIAAVLPFFTAALLAAQPADRRVRVGAIVAVAAGALAVSAGVVSSWTPVAVLGGVGYVAGITVLAVAAFAPFRRSLARRRPIVEIAHAAALGQLAVGALLATALLAGWAPVAERWLELKPAHGWLNLFGFVTAVVAATLIHLGPTVAGTRIRPRSSGRLAISGLATGPAVIALGYATRIDELARIGAVAVIAGGLGLAIHGVVVHRDGGTWTTDAG